MRRLWWKILLAVGFVVVPPVLFLLGVVVWAALDYKGMCYGVMDIPARACSVWEYIARNTVSPFALAAHMVICGGWAIFAVCVIAGVALAGWVVSVARRRKASGAA
jgi:hypothetical protein